MMCLYLSLPFCASAESESLDVITLGNATDAVNYGLQNSKKVSYQRLQTLENLRLNALSFRAFLPSVSLSYSENDSINIHAPDSRSKDFRVSLSQQVYSGGKTKLEYDMKRMSAQWDYQNFLQSTRDFQSELISQYYQVLMQRKTLEIKTRLCEAADVQLKILKREFELGQTLETDYLEYSISCSKLEIEKKKCERDLRKLEENFKTSLGLGKAVRLEISDSFASRDDYRLLSVREDEIVNKVKRVSVSLRKSELSLDYDKRLLQFESRQNLPAVSLQSSMSFSGATLPLTEPSFSLGCTISFQNPLLPITLTSGISANQQRIYGSNNSIEARILETSTYFSQRRLNRLSVLSEQQSYEESVLDLEKSVRDSIYGHDDSIRSVEMERNTISLMERRLAINKFQLDKGDMKEIDYLKQMISLSEEQVNLMNLQLSIESAERALEILMQLPFGEIHDYVE
jgi:Outer membrane protein